MTDKNEYKITAGGSLGLLALGDIGLEKWREVRKAAEKAKKEKKDDKGKEKE